jgi:SAM-dependent methyltransferase
VLHYLEDWTGPLAELRRVLEPGGRLIAAVEHPFAIALMHHMQGDKPAYFQTRSRTEEWTSGGHSAPITFWDRPLHAMTDAFTAADFRIIVISEPPLQRTPPRTALRLPQGRQPLGILPRLLVLRPGSQLIALDSSA